MLKKFLIIFTALITSSCRNSGEVTYTVIDAKGKEIRLERKVPKMNLSHLSSGEIQSIEKDNFKLNKQIQKEEVKATQDAIKQEQKDAKAKAKAENKRLKEEAKLTKKKAKKEEKLAKIKAQQEEKVALAALIDAQDTDILTAQETKKKVIPITKSEVKNKTKTEINEDKITVKTKTKEKIKHPKSNEKHKTKLKIKSKVKTDEIESEQLVKEKVTSKKTNKITKKKVTTKTSVAALKTPHYVQIGAYSIKASAINLQKEFSKVSDGHLKEVKINNKEIHRVLLGPVPNRQAAEELLNKVIKTGKYDAFITTK